MSYQLAPAPVLRVWDNSGNLAAGGSIFTYAAGTSTPAATYTDATGSTPLTNPVILNSRGEASIWLSQSQNYKFVAFDALGNLLWTDDQIQPPITSQSQTGMAGMSANAHMDISPAFTQGTFTADEIVVETALGGTPYKLTGVNQVINLALIGVGGMDTGTAPVNGFVSVYVIYNPSTSSVAMLACNQPTSSGSVYSGINMPAGYTASALISVWPTNGASQFVAGSQAGKQFSCGARSVLSTTTQQALLTNLFIGGAVPFSVLTVDGYINIAAGGLVGFVTVQITNAINSLIGFFNGDYTNSVNLTKTFKGVRITNSQTLAYSYTTSVGGSPTLNIQITGYTIP